MIKIRPGLNGTVRLCETFKLYIWNCIWQLGQVTAGSECVCFSQAVWKLKDLVR